MIFKVAPIDVPAAINAAVGQGWGEIGGKMMCAKHNKPLRHWAKYERVVPIAELTAQ